MIGGMRCNENLLRDNLIEEPMYCFRLKHGGAGDGVAKVDASEDSKKKENAAEEARERPEAGFETAKRNLDEEAECLDVSCRFAHRPFRTFRCLIYNQASCSELIN